MVGEGDLVGSGLRVAPGRPLGDALADPQGPAVDRGRSLGVVAGGLQQIGMDVPAGKPVDRRAVRLEDQQDPSAVGDRHATEEGAHPPSGRFDAQVVHQARRLRLERVDQGPSGGSSHRGSQWCRHPFLPSFRGTTAAAVQTDLPHTAGRQTDGRRRHCLAGRGGTSQGPDGRPDDPDGRPSPPVDGWRRPADRGELRRWSVRPASSRSARSSRCGAAA